MHIRKAFAVIVAITLVLGSFSFSFAADDVSTASSNATAFTDLSGHWAAGAINKWAGYGIIKGSEGLFRPDDSITRGELAVILDNMMDYQVKASNKFTDLQSGKFYTDAVLKANAAGIMKGDGTTVRPNDKITREEAAVMLSRAFAVKEASSGSAFADAAGISAWAKGAVYGMEAKGYINGYNGKFEPKANITRAAVVTMIDNIVKAYYTAAGTYTDNVAGTAVVKASGVTLKGVTVSGNLIIAEGVADGDATLDSVTVKGDTVIRGGGENSIHIIGNSSLSTVTIEKVDGKIRIAVDGTTVQEVDIAAGDEIILEGNFGTVTNDVPGAKIIAAAGSSINKIVADVKTDVSGTGTVKAAEFKAGADGSSITTPNTKITVDSGATGVTGGGGAAIPAGSTTTNNSSGTGVTKPSTGGGGDGHEVASPVLSIESMTCSTGAITHTGRLYTLPAGADETNCAIDVSITNTENVSYTLAVSIVGEHGQVAYADSTGIQKRYIDALSVIGDVTFNDLGRMFDRLGTLHEGWYHFSGVKKSVNPTDGNAFKQMIVEMFNSMAVGKTYEVTISLVPEGGTAGTLKFDVEKL